MVLFGLASFRAPVWLIDVSALFVLVMMLCGITGYLVDDRFGRLGLPVLWLVGLVAALEYPRPSWSMGIAVLAFMTVAWAVGLLIRYPIARARSAEEHAARLEEDQADAARRAVLEERQRIARELHDVVAHSVSVMTRPGRRRPPACSRPTRAGARRTGRGRAHRARGAGRDATRGRRAARRRRGGAARTAAGPGQHSRRCSHPVRAAGLAVELAVEGERRTLPPGLDLAAYRVVQEALTNALRHAGPRTPRCGCRYAPDDAADRGRERRASAAGPGGRGHGSAGMRERRAGCTAAPSTAGPRTTAATWSRRRRAASEPT